MGTFVADLIAGLRVRPGEVARDEVTLNPRERSYASERGNVAPTRAIVSIAVPVGFEPQKTWPVLVVLSTSDFNRKNSDDISLYLRPAMTEKWIVLTGDAPNSPRLDTLSWRLATTLAAVRALQESFHGAGQWPVACAGFSGGARRAAAIAPLLVLAGCRVSGLYLTGVNEDRLTPSYRRFLSGDVEFLTTPVFISSGSQDQIATQQSQTAVANAIKKAGFSVVRQESFAGGHTVKLQHVRSALTWFRSMVKE